MHPILQAVQTFEPKLVTQALKKYKHSDKCVNFLYELSRPQIPDNLSLYLKALEFSKKINWYLYQEKHPDLALYIITDWLVLANMYGRKDECQVLIKHGNSMIKKNIPLFVKSKFLSQYGYHLYENDNYELGKKYILDALNMLKSKKDTNYYIQMNRCAEIYIHEYKGDMMIDEIEKASANKNLSPYLKEEMLAIVLMHYVKMGELIKAEMVRKQFENIASARFKNTAILYYFDVTLNLFKYKNDPINLLKLEKELINKYESYRENFTDHYRFIKELLPALCHTQLLLRKLNEATSTAKLYDYLFCNENNEILSSENELLIYVNLASREIDYASFHLEKAKKQGSLRYFDYLSYGRIERIKGNNKKAKECFHYLWENVQKYKGEHLLDLHLNLALEISMKDWFIIFQSKEKVNKRILRNNDLDLNKLERVNIELIGESQEFKMINQKIEQYSKINSSVLIRGETGTGKELVAHAIHKKSKFNDNTFLPINCGAIAENLLETELFGHAMGAFTGAVKKHKGIFEEAGRGTVFLDEIGEISQKLQVVLLRVLETNEIRPVGETKTKKIHCRILAATNANLEDLIKKGKFRKDLYYRLNRLEIELAPLRKRKSDIAPLVEYFLNFENKNNFTIKISDGLKKFFINYEWPGNVRELKNTIEKMKILSSNKEYFSMEDVDFMQKEKFNLDYKSFDEIPIEINSEKINKESYPVDIDTSERQKKIEGILSKGKFIIRRLDIIRKLFKEHNQLTAKEITQITGFSPTTITKYLKTLCQQKFIKKMTPTNSPRTHYFQKT